MNAECQRIARRDKKAFLSNQCKEIEENNRMGKPRDLLMKCSFGISNFLEEISSLSHSVVFLYFFALIAEEGFLMSPWYCLELYIQMLISFLFSFAFCCSFTAICKASSDSHFAFLHFFSMGMVLIPVYCTMSQTSFINRLQI